MTAVTRRIKPDQSDTTPCMSCGRPISRRNMSRHTARCEGFDLSDPEQRFWVKVNPTGFCWEWTASVGRDGYGRFTPSLGEPTIQAHRYAYQALVGPIAPGMVADHLCRNRGCVNPDHIDIVTEAENIRRGYSPSAVLGRKAECRRGHPLVKRRDGSRRCKECQNIAQRSRRILSRAIDTKEKPDDPA